MKPQSRPQLFYHQMANYTVWIYVLYLAIYYRNITILFIVYMILYIEHSTCMCADRFLVITVQHYTSIECVLT